MNLQDQKITRRDERIDVSIEASYSDGKRFFNEQMLDLSIRGCRLEAMTPLKVGDRVTITANVSSHLKLSGIVRWVKKVGFRHHIGVEFYNVSHMDEKALRDVIQAVFWSNDRLVF